MSVSVPELNELLNDRTFARFIHTNLHMHTPVTPWDWNAYTSQSVEAGEITPEDYFMALNQTTLELVAITDHNCVEWCEPIIKLAKSARKNGTSRLHILPGVELTTYEGPHLIALFDEDFPVKDIRRFLTRLELSGDGLENDRVDKKLTISHILKEIERMEGIAIGPHIQSKAGLWGPREFRGRTDVLNDSRLRILAAPSGSIKRVTDQGNYPRFLYKTMDANVIQNSFAFINVSDCHRLDDFEQHTTWLKMSTPSLEGVRQIIYEPELRVSHEIIDTGQPVQYPLAMSFCPPPAPSHAHIIGIAVTGGMLDGEKMAFSPHQNCIIGKNYAGKSAILDCVRFALDILPSNKEAERLFVERLRAIVTEGGSVRLYVMDSAGKTYGISRTLLFTNIGSKNNQKWKIDCGPEVYYLFDNEFHKDSSTFVSSIFHAEVYPQGEVVKIKDNATQQMAIVDSLARLREKIEALKLEEVDGQPTLYGKLVLNGRDIMKLTERCEQIEGKLQTVPALQAEVARLEELVDSPLLKEVQQWTEISEKIRRYRTNLKAKQKSVFDLIPDSQNWKELSKDASTQSKTIATDFDSASPADFDSELDGLYKNAWQVIAASLSQSIREIDNILTQLEFMEQIVNAYFRNAKEEVEAQSENTSISELTQRITKKKRQLNRLEGLADEKKELERNLEKLYSERIEMKQRYLDEWQDIREERTRVVKAINRDSADNIEAELVQNADLSTYRELLGEIVKRMSSSTNRFSNYNQIDLIVESMTPQELVEIVAGGNANELTEVAKGVTLNNARLLGGMGLEDIHKLEICVPDDRLEIRLRKEGDDHFTPIDGGLSGGEQALALISVAMIQKDRPLIIDQPEDELGPALITGELVEQVRKVKPKRQLVFVTHIPNIPVLADSEQIVYVEQKIVSSQKSTRVACCGSLEDLRIVKRLLELDGGETAFDKRQKRYARLMV